jgi:HEAT repeat protein
LRSTRAKGEQWRPWQDSNLLRALADAGIGAAGWRLVELLADRTDEAGLRALADAGSDDAAELLAELLADEPRQVSQDACSARLIGPAGTLSPSGGCLAKR